MPCGIFIPRQWRLHRVLWALIIIEFPFTVANLTLFGVAAPNLYRTILWAEGGKRGFNSDPTTVLYAYANYRPVKTPVVWSGFNTQYNLVIGVLCTFFYLIKCTLFLMHVFYPILSLPLHIASVTLWAVSVYVQTAPDTIDPKRINNGAPWYITKNCDIVEDKTIRAYCMQAKSSFAVSVVMLVMYAFYLLLTLYSLYPTADARSAYASKRAAKKAEKEKYAISPSDNEMTAEEQWQHMWELQQLPRTPGTAGGLKSPLTPRTRAFQNLQGGMVPPPMPGATGFAAQGQGYGNGHGQAPYVTNAEYYGQQEEEEVRPTSATATGLGVGFAEYNHKEEGGEWKGKGSAY